MAVEEITTAKKDSLILNLDGAIAVCFVDLLRESGAFSIEEAEEYVKIGALNGLFVLGRSIGFTGKYLFCLSIFPNYLLNNIMNYSNF